MTKPASTHSVKSSHKASSKVVKPKEEVVLSEADKAAMVPVEGVPNFDAVRLDKRYVPARLPTGKVIGVWGDAIMRDPDGSIHQLQPGEEIKKGDVILTAQNGIVQMEADGSRFARGPWDSDLQGPTSIARATDNGLDPTELGNPGSLAGSLRVARLDEQAGGQSFAFGAADRSGLAAGLFSASGDAGNGPSEPTLDVQNIAVPESGVTVVVTPVAATIGAGTLGTTASPAAVSITPVTSGQGYAVFSLQLTGPATAPIDLTLHLQEGTAKLGEDFGSTETPTQGMEVSTDGGRTWQSTTQVSIAAGITEALVRVPVINDTIDEFDETFTLTATRTSPLPEQTVLQAQATIIDDDDAPRVVLTRDVNTAGDTVPETVGTVNYTFTLRDAAGNVTTSGKPITLNWSTTDGGVTGVAAATAGQDYTAGSGTITFAPGESTKTISVAVTNDKLDEADLEAFTINVTDGVNVTVQTPAVSTQIVDDDHAPVLGQLPVANTLEDVPRSGNVLTDATPPASDADAGDTVRVTDFTVNGVTTAAGSTATLPGVGTLVINPDGSYTFTPAPNYDGAVPPVSFTASDGANPVTGSLTITITPVNDAPTVVDAGAQVSELGLASANTALTTTTGTVQVSDVEGDALTVRLSGPSTDVTVGGGARTIVWTGTGTAADPLRGTVDSKEYVRATIDDSGHYTVELKAAIDAPASGTIDLGVVVSDGFQPTVPGPARSVTGTLSVAVVDDAPHVVASPTTVDVSRASTDLLLVLDTSGSMSTPDASGGSRLVSAIGAFQQLMADYAAQGDVHVRIVTFSDAALQQGDGWLTAAQAKTLLDGITKPDGNNTNYADAISVAMAAYGNGSGTAGAKSVAYFLSDGLPTTGQSISADQQTAWEQFLASHGTKAVTVGFGDFQGNTADSIDPDDARAAMAPIAYDGGTGQQLSTSLVATSADLSTLLESTVPPTVQGYLAGSSTSTGAAGGADHAYIASVTVDGKTYTFNGVSDTTPAATGAHQFDAATHVLTITTSKGGTLTIDMDDGRYGYQPPAQVQTGYQDQVRYTVADRDGDTVANNELFVNVTPNATGASATAGTQDASASMSTAQAASAASLSGSEAIHATPLADVFSWSLSDAGTAGQPSTTHVTGFGTAAASAGGDTLDLRDLLTGELAGAQGQAGNLDHYLDFKVNGSGSAASTTLQISAKGGFTAGHADAAAVDKVIVLDNVDLIHGLGLDAQAGNRQVIEALLQQGKLVVDHS